MKRMVAAANPEAYLAGLDGWRRDCVAMLRAAVRAAAPLEEVIKWGNLVYLAGGPVLMIRAEEHRVLVGFWRGQRLRQVEPRLVPGGKYEMATVELRQDTAMAPEIVRRLARDAVELNRLYGDPTAAAPTPRKRPANHR